MRNKGSEALNKISLPELRVLVVDDDSFFLRIMNATLERLGVTDAVLKDQSVDILEELENANDRYDLVFCDLNMPDIDGWSIIRKLVEQNFRGSIALISGEDKRILNAAATLTISSGVTLAGSLRKPVKLADLEQLLNRACEKPTDQQTKKFKVSVDEDQLRRAIEAGEIVAFYQPKVSSKDKHISGFEALARWRTGDHTFIYPADFIPLAEETNLSTDIFFCMLSQAVEDLQRWNARGLQFNVAINLDLKTLLHLDLPDNIARIVDEAGISRRQISIEMTESQYASGTGVHVEVLCRLAMMGFALSVDDFGTGYSSMSKLTTFPFHELKVDRSFCHNAETDEIARAIVNISTTLGHQLGMNVVSEGVETDSDWRAVTEAGVDIVQGYFVARPMPRDKVDEWVENWTLKNGGTETSLTESDES